jgi:NAD(P)-dependent dehydrogenase (short-subunit alcohol dehydrogenase family)
VTSPQSSDGRVWLITGTSTGFGRALAEAVIARGDRLVATARRPESIADLVALAPEQVHAIALDVTVPEQVRAAVAAAHEAFGRIDCWSTTRATACSGRSRRSRTSRSAPSLRLTSLGCSM